MRIIRSLVAVFALLLAVSGCNNDDSGSSSASDETPDTPSSSATEATEPSLPTASTPESSMATDTGSPVDGGGDAGSCYLSDSDVAAETGITGASEDNSAAGVTNCTWSATTGDSLTLSVQPELGAYDETVSATEGVIGPSEPLDGVGDKAAIMYGDDLVPQAAVIFVAGDKLVALILTTTSGKEQDLRTQITALAQKVADNI